MTASVLLHRESIHLDTIFFFNKLIRERTALSSDYSKQVFDIILKNKTKKISGVTQGEGGGQPSVKVCEKGGGWVKHGKKRDVFYGQPLCNLCVIP